MSTPLLIGHRGASGHVPEHTLASYALALLQGADYIEPDLVATRDGVLVARHENEIGGTTDVAAHPEFEERKRTQYVDGVDVSGWFTEDFTLAELKSLRARERIPEVRPQNRRFDGRFDIPTLNEILQYLGYVNSMRAPAGLGPIGIYPETKHPSHFASIGLALEPLLLDALKAWQGAAPVFIQSFEVGNLRQLRRQCEYPLVQLMAAEGAPWDQSPEKGGRYASMATATGLKRVAEYATAVGVQKTMVMAEAAGGRQVPTMLVEHAHAAGLKVHVWAFRAENMFLPVQFRQGAGLASHGDLAGEIRLHVQAGIDGLFCDHPDLARMALAQITSQ
ncbi:MAG TPA: glycerophosphodiester phosphodiesterase family protein [Steroidobacteraceae bacterium]|nr:glycerophosphodiester phosphodiesterase family protein [Steroidobacteraceae bacterium]